MPQSSSKLPCVAGAIERRQTGIPVAVHPVLRGLLQLCNASGRPQVQMDNLLKPHS